MSKMKLTLMLAGVFVASAFGLTFLAVPGGPANAASEKAADITTSDVLTLPLAEGEVTGFSELVRTDNGVSMSLTTTGLVPGGAYTVWWVVFNNPGGCIDGCGADDLPNPTRGNPAGVAVGHAAGHVVDETGTATFAGHLNEGEPLLESPGPLVAGSLGDARTAEIHLVVRYHGLADPGRIDEQIHTFEPALNTDGDPATGDVQGSAHVAP